jgi:large subunit ribosomal protein L23
MDPRDVLIRPLVTEKNNMLMEKNQYVFQVPINANKYQIKNAVEQIFKVNVTGVSTIRMPGKLKRMGRNEGRRPDWKKAIVTVAEGQRIAIFEGL